LGLERSKGYTLVVCEKSDVAKRMAEALAGHEVLEGRGSYSVLVAGKEVVFCAAQGHLYGISDPSFERTVFPVFDLEWFQDDLIGGMRAAGRKIGIIRGLCEHAAAFMNACDLDPEGEVIGFNILRYSCNNREGTALRAKFSALTKEDLTKAFTEAETVEVSGLAKAGRARHYADFVWGVNLSRVLSGSTPKYKTVSIGRVQGPALGFVVEREKEIRTFVPIPYWAISGTFAKGKETFSAPYLRPRIRRRDEASSVRLDCVHKQAVVEEVDAVTEDVPPPFPFNTGTLQREAFSQFGFSPSVTSQIAERLYLRALISYPRTDSQKLPHSIGYHRILEGLGRNASYSAATGGLLSSRMRPVQGTREDPAHPAIYPTGVLPRGGMSDPEQKLYDLIVRRFLSAFGPEAKQEVVSYTLAVGEHRFRLVGRTTVALGWLRSYGKYSRLKDFLAPRLSVGEVLAVVDVAVTERYESRPQRYTQAGLVERMERERMGTKATRADIVQTLQKRGYVDGLNLVATDLGFAVHEAMKKYSPLVVSTELTRQVEDGLNDVESRATDDKDFLRDVVRRLTSQMIMLESARPEIGRELALAGDEAGGIGTCPVCGDGRLVVIRSSKTRKRFIGCTNYSHGCRASAPLPQRGTLRFSDEPCTRCRWPLVSMKLGRFRRTLCVNMGCPSRLEKR